MGELINLDKYKRNKYLYLLYDEKSDLFRPNAGEVSFLHFQEYLFQFGEGV